MSKKQQKTTHSPRVLNRKARYDYHILETIEAGIVLKGCEVKSIREGQVSLAEGFARIEPETMELYLYGVDIAPYVHARGMEAPERQRPRKILLHKREIVRLMHETTPKGTTIVPLAMYFVRGNAKIELGIARGKGDVDKRQTIKHREADREIQRGMTRKVL